MTYDAKEFAQYPEIMNKEQLRKVCHISKRTAHYLLQFNLIPHVCTGKKTRCYAIKKSDVIDFMTGGSTPAGTSCRAAGTNTETKT